MGTFFLTPIEVERPPLNPNSWLRHLPMVFALDVLGVRLLILTPSAKGKPPRAGSVNDTRLGRIHLPEGRLGGRNWTACDFPELPT
jgi:hypothetical protein